MSLETINKALSILCKGDNEAIPFDAMFTILSMNKYLITSDVGSCSPFLAHLCLGGIGEVGIPMARLEIASDGTYHPSAHMLVVHWVKSEHSPQSYAISATFR